MKVAVISLHFSEYISGLVSALLRHHEILLILNRDNFDREVGNDVIFRGLKGLTVFYLSHTHNLLGVPPRAWKLTQIIRNFGPDVIHCQEDTKDYLALALPFLNKVPFVLTVHDPKPHTGLDERRRKLSRHRAYSAQLRARADMVIVHGDRLIPIAEEVMPRLAGRVFSIPHGPNGNLLNSKTHLDWQPGNCLFFGRIESYKGLPYFIEAVRILRGEGVAITGVIAGKGTELDRLKPTLESDPAFVLKDRYLSPPDVRECFLEANVVVLPYVDATQSGVAACALGVGRPVIATNVGGLPDMVRDGESGILIPPRDATALAAAIRRVIETPALARSMAAAALKLASGELSWREIACKTSEVYDRATRR
jgi:glycosyltransferase involved in cell wall biosynthesis